MNSETKGFPSDQPPRVFISYSWTTPEYEQAVLSLAQKLVRDGIDAVLDKWELKPGQDTNVFMESMVHDEKISRVLVLCDRRYSEKANDRSGGVGTESLIISPKIYADVEQTKFIPVVMERDENGQPYLPVYLHGRKYVDYSRQDAQAYDEIVRLLWNEPLQEKPPIGTKPKFLVASAPTTDALVGIQREIERGGQSRLGAFCDELTRRAMELVISPMGEGTLAEKVEKRVEMERSIRPVIRQTVLLLLRSSKSAGVRREEIGDIFTAMHSACKQVAGSNYEHGRDVVYYLARNVLIEVVAECVREKQYSLVQDLLSVEFVASNGTARLESFTEFGHTLPMIDGELNLEKDAKKISYSTDLFLTHPAHESPSNDGKIEADLILFVASVLRDGFHWIPFSSLYRDRGSPTNLFLRLASPASNETVNALFRVQSWDYLKEKVRNYVNGLKYPIVPGSHWGNNAMLHINMGK